MDTLRNLLNNDPAKLAQHVLVEEQTVDRYLLNNWKWNEGRYGVQKSLRELVDTLNQVRCMCYLQFPLNIAPTKEITSIDNTMKAKLNNYNLVKGSLVQMQRKMT